MIIAQSDVAAQATATQMGFAVGVLVIFAVFLIPAIFYCLTLQKALNRCSPESRAMQPGMVWLLFVPLFNLVWQFFVVINVAKSLGAEFQKRGMAEEPEPGKTLGLAMCILGCCGIIPVIGVIISIGALVC
jgi:hypothetical protein